MHKSPNVSLWDLKSEVRFLTLYGKSSLPVRLSYFNLNILYVLVRLWYHQRTAIKETFNITPTIITVFQRVQNLPNFGKSNYNKWCLSDDFAYRDICVPNIKYIRLYFYGNAHSRRSYGYYGNNHCYYQQAQVRTSQWHTTRNVAWWIIYICTAGHLCYA